MVLKQFTLDEMRDPKRRRLLTEAEDDCMREIQCYVRGGAPTQQMLPRVIQGMWSHWGIEDCVAKQHILQTSGAYDAGMDVVNLM